MKRIFRNRLPRFVTLAVLALFLFPSVVLSSDKSLTLDSSTQIIWGDDYLGNSQNILAQYLRLSFDPTGKNYEIAGYGRLWKNFTEEGVRSDDGLGRLYYLYLDYIPFESTLVRAGRHYVNFSAGSSIMDGVSVDINNLGPLGISLSGGNDVKLSLDSEYSSEELFFLGADLHLVDMRPLELGMSYVRKYDDWDVAREHFGLNISYIYRYASPYAELKYDNLSEVIDEATVGIDLFPVRNLTVKGELYHSYATFESTSIFSVFAVDQYREYLIFSEYSFSAPVTLFASHTWQLYGDDEDANVLSFGSRLFPTDRSILNLSIDKRTGYGGDMWGFEATGNYHTWHKIDLSLGAQYDAYKRPDFSDDDFDSAQRYWVGGEWFARNDIYVSFRIEDNINENFNHRPLTRVALNWIL
jgi:hypothetical protein